MRLLLLEEAALGDKDPFEGDNAAILDEDEEAEEDAKESPSLSRQLRRRGDGNHDVGRRGRRGYPNPGWTITDSLLPPPYLSCSNRVIYLLGLSSSIFLPPFLKVGEVFMLHSTDATSSMLEQAKEIANEDITRLQADIETIQEVLKNLKVQLYAKFGDNINLEEE